MIFALFILANITACFEIPDTGHEGAPCFSKGWCYDNLVCSPQNICVKPGGTDGGDGGTTDSGLDGGIGDGGIKDAGAPDAGDGGTTDSGLDGGIGDSGIIDAGTPDAGPDAGVSISDITPADPYVSVSHQKQFTAAVSGAEDTSIIWSASAGVIDGNGLYTAPASPVSGVTIMAKANAKQTVFKQTTANVVAMPHITSFIANLNPTLYDWNTNLTGVFENGTGWVDNGVGALTSGTPYCTIKLKEPITYTLAVTNPAGEYVTEHVDVGIQTVEVSDITPSNPNVTVNHTKQFSATVTGAGDSTVDWEASCGTFDASGLYTAPAAPTSCTITARSHGKPDVYKTTGANVIDEPKIISFTANPSSILMGEITNLTAVFTGGSGKIEPGNISVNTGTPVAVSSTTTEYTLNVSNLAGDLATQKVNITFTTNCGPSPTGKGGDMCDVPAGSFMMGCNSAVDNECESDGREKPYHSVTIPAFKTDKYEVTVSEYAACNLDSPSTCTTPNTGVHCTWNISGKESHPINCLDWVQAKAYCTWAGKKLPSESEWEKAARGTGGWKYPWGNRDLDCNHVVMSVSPCTSSGTAQVGSKPAGVSPYGAMDMIGNVWEWVEDDYHSTYNGVPVDGSAWIDAPRSSFRVLRGGSWTSPESFLRSSNRIEISLTERVNDLGFRCAWSSGGFSDGGSDGGTDGGVVGD